MVCGATHNQLVCKCQRVWVRGRPGRIYLRAPRGAWVFRLRLSSFVFLFSTLVLTAGCLSHSPSLVLAEALHVGFFFFYFSSLAIHSASFVSSGFLVMMWQVEVVVVRVLQVSSLCRCCLPVAGSWGLRAV